MYAGDCVHLTCAIRTREQNSTEIISGATTNRQPEKKKISYYCFPYHLAMKEK